MLLLAICKLCINDPLNSKHGREVANYSRSMVRLSWTQCQHASAVERTEELWVIRTMEHDPPGTNGFESIWGVCRKYLLTHSLQLGINSVSLTHTSLNGMLVPSGHVKFVEWTKSVPGGLLQNSFSNLNSSVGRTPRPALMKLRTEPSESL